MRCCCTGDSWCCSQLRDAQHLVPERKKSAPSAHKSSEVARSPSLEKSTTSALHTAEPEEVEIPQDLTDLSDSAAATPGALLPHLAAPLKISDEAPLPVKAAWSGQILGFMAFSAPDPVTTTPSASSTASTSAQKHDVSSATHTQADSCSSSTRRSTSDKNLTCKVTISEEKRLTTRSVSTGALSKQHVEKLETSYSSGASSARSSRRSSLTGQATGFLAFADDDPCSPPSVSFDDLTFSASSSRASMNDIAAELEYVL
jgi:hypothetical protein